MGSLLHPAIGILCDVLEEGSDLYLVMEYYPSKNLRAARLFLSFNFSRI